MGDVRRQLVLVEQRLRVAGRNDVDLAVVVELTHCVEGPSFSRRSQGERFFELGLPFSIGAAAGQQFARVLFGEPEPLSQIGDREAFVPQERLPDLWVLAHCTSIVPTSRRHERDS
jgi:hypothetical protein